MYNFKLQKKTPEILWNISVETFLQYIRTSLVHTSEVDDYAYHQAANKYK